MNLKEVKQFRLGELFCGPGGLAYAAVNSQIEDLEYKIVHEWANDYDLDTCKTYTRNICPSEPDSVICGDVRKLDIETIIDDFTYITSNKLLRHDNIKLGFHIFYYLMKR